jgi:hypothetical protein
MPVGENVVVRGEADGIYKLENGKLVIVDFKTAFERGIDDPLLPIYMVQLNAYAMLAEAAGLPTVEKLALVYCEPLTGPAACRLKENGRDDGFAMSLRSRILEIPLEKSAVTDAAETAWDVYSQPTAPNGRDGCKDCKALAAMIATSKAVIGGRAAYATIGV